MMRQRRSMSTQPSRHSPRRGPGWSAAVSVTLLLAGCSAAEEAEPAADGASVVAEQDSATADTPDPEPEDPSGSEPGAAGGVDADGVDDPESAPDSDANGSGETVFGEGSEGEVASGEGGDGGDGEVASGEGSEGEDVSSGGNEGSETPASSTTGEHRPPPAAQAALDCAAVTDPPPGAIIVFPADDDPSWLEAGPGPVIVEFIGCSESFEANLQYEAFHEQDTTPTLSGITQGGTLGTWDAFGFEDTYWTPGDWTVVVFVNDALSGARVEYDEVTFTVD